MRITNYCQYVAFLRGINVGGRTLVKMECLRKELEALGYRGVKTVLASGNVVFEAPGDSTPSALSQEISRKLKGGLGREVLVIVRPVEELRELAAKVPFGSVEAAEGTRMFVTFLAGAGSKSQAGIPERERRGFRILSVSNGMICSVLEERQGVGGAELMGAIEKWYGRDVTTRSWSTIEKILKIV
ncbi:MAG TPA: DUF1697 domain-containing protein [Methanocella sp.]|nr:DUF1697 domain-containing protein [Methanocella sp.]